MTPDTPLTHLPMTGTEDYRRHGWWRTDTTTLDDIRRAAAQTPHKPAFVCSQDDATVTITYGQLPHLVDKVAGNLIRLGITPGDVITLQLPNSWQLNILLLACARVGAVAAPVVPIMRHREVEYMMRLTQSPLYIAADTYRDYDYTELADELASSLPCFRTAIIVGEHRPHRWPEFTEALLGDHDISTATLTEREAHPDDLAQIMFTSGTTGEPKGVMHTHNTLHAMNHAQAHVLGLTADDVTALGSPTTHQAGYTWNFLMPLLLGATSIHLDRWDPHHALDLMHKHGVTFFMGAPTFLADLIDAQSHSPRDLSALTTFATGSAPIPPVLVEECAAVLGCRLYALWGMTENGCVTITRPEQPALRAAESDGTVVNGMAVRIWAADGTGPAAAGQTGLLQVRGASQCLGYYRRPEVYAACTTDDGWFDTGDLARDDGHGGIRITGRVKDIILRGGENIPVVEVEGELLRHPAIKDVAVIGYPDNRLGERACAVVVATTDLTLLEVTDHLAAAGMAKPYWPERLEQRRALPRTPSGKIQKFVLREELRQAA